MRLALGARVNETPLREPEAGTHVVDGIETTIVVPNRTKPRSVGARAMPIGSVPGFAPLSMDVNDPYTMQCSLKKRLFRQLPLSNPVVLQELEKFVFDWVDKNISPIEPLEFEEWLDTTSYNEHRKNQLRRCHSELGGKCPSVSQCRHIDTHGKHESYPEYKHARAINSRSDYFKAFSGPIFKAIESELYRHSYFVKHLLPEERAKRIVELKTVGNYTYATDFTAFESHFTPEVMEILEMQLYRKCLVKYPELYAKIHDTIAGTNSIRIRGGLRARVKGRRMSGDMNTSLGNGFSNLMLCMFVCSKRGDVLKFDGVFEGDDGLFTSDAIITDEHFTELGFTVKIEKVDDPRRASFCGLIFGANMETIRDPVRFLNNFGWTETYVNAGNKVLYELMKAKSLSALHETPQCPIVGVMARKMYFACTGKTRFTDPYKKKMYDRPWYEVEFNPSMDTRMLFAEVYGVSIETQLAIERAILTDTVGVIQRMLRPHLDVEDYITRFVEDTTAWPSMPSDGTKYGLPDHVT